MHREYHKHYSCSLQREMELLIFGHAGKAVLFFPTRMARFYDYENWRVIEPIRDRIEAGEMQIFCVDSVDAESFYNKHAHPSARICRHLQYERYIIHEVLPFMQMKNGAEAYEIAGCSMGAYHAVNFALKFPSRFYKIVAMSGRYDLTQSLQHFSDLFDGYHDENIYFNMPIQFIPNLSDPFLLQCIRETEIILAIGQEDPFLSSNQYVSHLLNDKGVHHQLHVWDGEAHRPRHWRQMVRLYL